MLHRTHSAFERLCCENLLKLIKFANDTMTTLIRHNKIIVAARKKMYEHNIRLCFLNSLLKCSILELAH